MIELINAEGYLLNTKEYLEITVSLKISSIKTFDLLVVVSNSNKIFKKMKRAPVAKWC